MKKLLFLAATASLFLAAPAQAARPTLAEAEVYGTRVTTVDAGMYNYDTLVIDGHLGTETITVMCVDGGGHDWESWGYMYESQRYYERYVQWWCANF